MGQERLDRPTGPSGANGRRRGCRSLVHHTRGSLRGVLRVLGRSRPVTEENWAQAAFSERRDRADAEKNEHEQTFMPILVHLTFNRARGFETVVSSDLDGHKLLCNIILQLEATKCIVCRHRVSLKVQSSHSSSRHPSFHVILSLWPQWHHGGGRNHGSMSGLNGVLTWTRFFASIFQSRTRDWFRHLTIHARDSFRSAYPAVSPTCESGMFENPAIVLQPNTIESVSARQ